MDHGGRSVTREEATATLARGAPPPPIGAVLRVSGVTHPPAPYLLEVGRCTVGSAEGCDIVVEEPTVSRRHVELSLVPEGIAVRDLGSRNGTYYLGQRVEKMTLTLGARLQVGSATLSIEADPRALDEALLHPGDEYAGMVGRSTAMRRIFGVIERLRGSLATVLVEGESGVGKELIARALHETSTVASGPLVALNCGALPNDLVASELFGHRRGAFTGAVDTRKGAFESADAGTLFLDEVGELPLDVQPTLLRAVETGEVRPIGDDAARRVRVRFVVATNRDLEGEVAQGRFREDLYWRLAVVKLRVPPLRERPEDVEPLAHRFAAALGAGELSDAVVAALRARSWPGNARELRNAVQAYAALGVLPEPTRSKSGTLDLALREAVDLGRPYAALKEKLVDEFTRVYLDELLDHTRGNQSAAARIADLDRTYLGRLVQKHRPRSGG
jgi:transcriptional regulator with GAF, ATPase, and Fis domain